MSDYVLGPDADLDLDAIWEYIARDNIDAADRWIARLFDAFEALGQNPGIGHKREDLTQYPVLFWPVGSYLIIYHAERRPIEVVAVTQPATFLHFYSSGFMTDDSQVQPRICLAMVSFWMFDVPS